MNDYLEDNRIRALADEEHPSLPGAQEFKASNPLCGDRIKLSLKIEDQVIKEAGYEIRGCILSRAAAAIFARNARGENLQNLKMLEQELRKMLKGEGEISSGKWQELTIFKVCLGNRSRHECVLLPFRAIK